MRGLSLAPGAWAPPAEAMQGSAPKQLPAALSEDFDRAAERLLATLGEACEPGASFLRQVEGALRATLALFAAEPELGRLLTVRPFATQGEAIPSYLEWQQRCAGLLRAAAERSPDAHSNPPFVETRLVGGISWRIARCLSDEGPEHLPELLTRAG